MSADDQRVHDNRLFAEQVLGVPGYTGDPPPPGTAAGDLVALWRRCRDAGLPESEFTRLAQAVWARHQPTDDWD